MPMATDLTQCDKRGAEASIYYDTADDPSIAGGSACTTPTWVYNKAVTGDLTITETEDEEELSSRDPAMIYKQYAESKADLEVSGELMVDILYEGYIYMNAMRAGSYARNLLVLTGYLTNLNEVGFKGKFRNFERTISAPESGPQKQTFKLKPAACVKVGCKISPVKTAAAGTTAVYDPGLFAEYDAESLANEIRNHSIYRGIHNTEAEEIFTDVGPLITWLGVEEVDKMLVSLVESNLVLPANQRQTARRVNNKPTGMGGFDRAALVKALDEIVKNVFPE